MARVVTVDGFGGQIGSISLATTQTADAGLALTGP
jgi:hypothetical protein